MEAHVSLRVRRTLALAAIAVAAILLFAVSSQRADAKAKHSQRGRQGAEGPQVLQAAQEHPGPARHADLGAQGHRAWSSSPDAKYTKLVLYSSRTPQGAKDAISGSVSVPKGKPPKGGWPVITWAHGTTGVADICAPSRDGLDPSANTGETYINPDLNAWLRGRVRGPADRLRGPRHARQASVPDRHLGGPQRPRHRRGRAPARSEHLQALPDLRPLAGRPGRALRGRRWRAAGSPKLKLRGTVAFAPASHILDQASLLPALTAPSGLTALATLILDGASTQSSAINVNQILSDQVLPFYPLLQSQCLCRLGPVG